MWCDFLRENRGILRLGWGWYKHSTFAFEYEIEIVILLVLFLENISLSCNFLYKENFHLLYHFPCHRSELWNISNQKINFLFASWYLCLFHDLVILVLIYHNDLNFFTSCSSIIGSQIFWRCSKTKELSLISILGEFKCFLIRIWLLSVVH